MKKIDYSGMSIDEKIDFVMRNNIKFSPAIRHLEIVINKNIKSPFISDETREKYQKFLDWAIEQNNS